MASEWGRKSYAQSEQIEEVSNLEYLSIEDEFDEIYKEDVELLDDVGDLILLSGLENSSDPSVRILANEVLTRVSNKLKQLRGL